MPICLMTNPSNVCAFFVALELATFLSCTSLHHLLILRSLVIILDGLPFQITREGKLSKKRALSKLRVCNLGITKAVGWSLEADLLLDVVTELLPVLRVQ